MSEADRPDQGGRKPALKAVRLVAVKATAAPVVASQSFAQAEPPVAEPVNAVPVIAQPDPPKATPPNPETQDPRPTVARYSERAKARAELVSVYAGWQGVDLAVNDILEQITRDFPQKVEFGLSELSKVLNAHGMKATLETAHWCTPDQWPAIAQMVNGQLVLVLSQNEGVITIYDPTQTDRRAEVTVVEFDPYFSGLTLKAQATIAKISDTHIKQKLADHWFWGEFHRQRRAFGEIALGSFVANLLAIAVALFSLQVYDRVIPHQSQATLWVLAIGALLALGLESLLKIARARLMDVSGRRIELAVQKRLMDRLLGMKSQPGGPSPSTLFQAMREFGSVREFFTASTVGTIADMPFIVVFLVLVAFIGGPVVWVLIAGGILMVLPSLLMQKKMVALTKQSQGASAKAARILHETIFEHETLRSQRGEDRVRRLWSEMLTLTSSNSSDQRKLASALTYWAQGVQQATYVAAVIMGAYLVFAGDFTVGTIIAIGILTGRTLAPLAQLAGTLSRWTNVKAALEGLEAIASAEQTEEEGRTYLRRDSIKGEFELRNVTFRYDKDAGATVDVQALAINPGQKIAVLGPNGSGKSTLLRLLAGLYAPDAGRIMLDGVEMSQIHPRDLRRNIGYLGQEVRLFAGNLRDNLNLTQLERDDDRLFKALEFAGLAPFVKGHPKGLDMEIRDGGEGLSVGQRQSIGWARVWLQDPSVVLLDEPTAALDQTLETTLVSRLGDWLAGRTALIATHRVPILALTDRVILLQNGKPTVDGPRAAVLAHLATGGKAANSGAITGTIAGGKAG